MNAALGHRDNVVNRPPRRAISIDDVHQLARESSAHNPVFSCSFVRTLQLAISLVVPFALGLVPSLALWTPASVLISLPSVSIWVLAFHRMTPKNRGEPGAGGSNLARPRLIGFERFHPLGKSPRWESLKVCYHKPATMWRGGLDRSLPNPRKRGVLIERSAPRLFLGVPTAPADHQRGWHTKRHHNRAGCQFI